VDLFDLQEPAPKVEDDDGFQFTIPQLPLTITQVILPWVLTLGCLGWSIAIAVERIIPLPGRLIGFAMLGVATLLYAALLVPLTLKSISSAAATAKLRLPNVVWFQTFALLSLPTAGLVIGADAGGTASIITFGLLGLAAMTVLMALMYRADVMQTMLTAFYGASAYVGSAALCVAILVGIGLILNKANLESPWHTATSEVADASKGEPKPAAPSPTAVNATTEPVVVAPPPVEVAPVVQAAPAPVLPAGPPWVVPVEPLAPAAMWPALSNTVSQSIPVTTPVGTVHTIAGGPFVGLVQPKTLPIYDLRNGRQTGFVKAGFQIQNLIISSDGKLAAGIETPASLADAIIPTDAPPGTIEIWSTNNEMVGRVPSAMGASIPLPLAFADGKLIASGSSGGMIGLQAWDPITGSMLHQWNTPGITRSSMAISNSGQFIAAAGAKSIQLFSVQSGEIAGELTSPGPLSQIKGIAFSPDGKTIAAVVPGDADGAAAVSMGTSAGATLLEWNVAGEGKLARAVPIDLSATLPPFTSAVGTSLPDAADVPYLQWTPDGRMVRAGHGLFEITSGKTIFTLTPQMSGNLSGRLISVENKRAMYEFMPTGLGSRLLIKSIDLPASTIDSAVAFAIASMAKPTAAAEDPTAAPTTSASSTAVFAATSPAYSALLVPPQSLTAGSTLAAPTKEIAAMGKWDVQIKSISRLAGTTRLASAAMDSGIQLQITTDTDATAAIVDFMRPGDRVHITGTGKISQNLLIVKLLAASPLQSK
jgi:hypothetical protein